MIRGRHMHLLYAYHKQQQFTRGVLKKAFGTNSLGISLLFHHNMWTTSPSLRVFGNLVFLCPIPLPPKIRSIQVYNPAHSPSFWGISTSKSFLENFGTGGTGPRGAAPESTAAETTKSRIPKLDVSVRHCRPKDCHQQFRELLGRKGVHA